MSTLIIIGGTGELGRKTVAAAEATDENGWSGDIIATYRSSAPRRTSGRVQWQSLDCADHSQVRSLLASQASLSTVLYCAIPKGGNASAKPNESLRAGIVDDVLNCAEAVAMMGARFIAVSTDLVFDGKLDGGLTYGEDSETGPVNAYGEYKAQMERRLLSVSGNIVIARTSLILTWDEDGGYGKGMQFVVDCIKGKHGEIELFTDEVRNMSFADDLGRAMVELGKEDCKHIGIVHMVSDENTNRWELAKLVAKQLGLEDLLGRYARSGLSTASGMLRPLNCSLSTKLRATVLKTKIQGISQRLG